MYDIVSIDPLNLAFGSFAVESGEAAGQVYSHLRHRHRDNLLWPRERSGGVHDGDTWRAL
jgi:hypothetical protein